MSLSAATARSEPSVWGRAATPSETHGPDGQFVLLAAAHRAVRLQLRLERLRLLKAQGHLLHHLSVGASHQDAHLLQGVQLRRHLFEAADEEVATAKAASPEANHMRD